ncbi:hypothetical protein CAOG_02915 [Capsaspora owczarzaki ATCC 30864]|uniref:Uncharacterized protein n=1 Tax=Capsaspora owczarzaki (strain ATCC 30864) TaxID=595528 RepID=A0A0D2WM42_CAPO3|nr:hypothetical protein CAOG_02915 [Capsaspora owczarzaki ATCC 30864]KJE91840.1 hypothetical protein CAOG_002915 [Capsaspora owczarzaki ATCC 30864]|eukprot:XP_004363754.1 hypothetical protein CAOG_02915 [Capsaspora owczarzaki ATCC 30864]
MGDLTAHRCTVLEFSAHKSVENQQTATTTAFSSSAAAATTRSTKRHRRGATRVRPATSSSMRMTRDSAAGFQLSATHFPPLPVTVAVQVAVPSSTSTSTSTTTTTTAAAETMLAKAKILDSSILPRIPKHELNFKAALAFVAPPAQARIALPKVYAPSLTPLLARRGSAARSVTFVAAGTRPAFYSTVSTTKARTAPASRPVGTPVASSPSFARVAPATLTPQQALLRDRLRRVRSIRQCSAAAMTRSVVTYIVRSSTRLMKRATVQPATHVSPLTPSKRPNALPLMPLWAHLAMSWHRPSPAIQA